MDAITGEARNSLSEEKLLRQHLDVNVVESVVENGNGVIPIKLLDTDTISQAKEKILDVLYRNTPVSRRPQLSEVDLELRRGNAGIKLCDYDGSNIREGVWVKVNTLGHYKLDQMVSLVLVFLFCISSSWYICTTHSPGSTACPPYPNVPVQILHTQSQLHAKNPKCPQPTFMLTPRIEGPLSSSSKWHRLCSRHWPMVWFLLLIILYKGVLLDRMV